MSIAAYLREQRGNLDEVLKQERLASSSLTKEQRRYALYAKSGAISRAAALDDQYAGVERFA